MVRQVALCGLTPTPLLASNPFYDICRGPTTDILVYILENYSRFDGTSEPNIPWTSGAPTGLELVATLGDGSVKDVDASAMTALVCKRAATSKPHDSSAKFA